MERDAFDSGVEFDELLRAQAEFMDSGKAPAARVLASDARQRRNLLYSRLEQDEGQVFF